MYDVRCKKAADALLDAGRRQYFIAEQDNRVVNRVVELADCSGLLGLTERTGWCRQVLCRWHVYYA